MGEGSPGSRACKVSKGLAYWEIAKSWTGLGFKGLAMDIKSKLGAGNDLSRSTREPREWGSMGPFATLSGRTGQARVEFRAWAQAGVRWESSEVGLQSSCPLSSSLLSTL